MVFAQNKMSPNLLLTIAKNELNMSLEFIFSLTNVQISKETVQLSAT